MNMWWVVGHADVRSILNYPAHSTVGTDVALIRDIFGENMLTLDGTHHALLRKYYRGMLVLSEVIRAMRPKIEAIANQLIDGCAHLETAELRPAFAERFPVFTMQALFVIDEQAEADVRQWHDAFEAALANCGRGPDVRARGLVAASEFRFFSVVIRKKHPTQSLFSLAEFRSLSV